MDRNITQTLGKMTYGIYVLTTRHEQIINGMIASWVSQVSYEPMLIMAAIHPDRYTHALIEKSKSFALHILSKEQKDLITQFKGPDPAAKFASLNWAEGKTGAPVLKNCIGYLECRVKIIFSPGNHLLYIGEVIAAGFSRKDTPLSTLDYEGVYTGRK